MNHIEIHLLRIVFHVFLSIFTTFEWVKNMQNQFENWNERGRNGKIAITGKSNWMGGDTEQPILYWATNIILLNEARTIGWSLWHTIDCMACNRLSSSCCFNEHWLEFLKWPFHDLACIIIAICSLPGCSVLKTNEELFSKLVNFEFFEFYIRHFQSSATDTKYIRGDIQKKAFTLLYIDQSQSFIYISFLYSEQRQIFRPNWHKICKQ